VWNLVFFVRFVEYDVNAQREVAANKEVMNKFVEAINIGLNTEYFEIDQEYCLAANTLFYVSFDQQAIKTSIESGIHLKIMDKVYPAVRSWITKTKKLIIWLVIFYVYILWRGGIFIIYLDLKSWDFGGVYHILYESAKQWTFFHHVAEW